MTKRHRRRKAGSLYNPNDLLQKNRLRVDEAAFLLDVSTRTVENYMRDGKIDYGLTPGGRRRPLVESVRKYL